MQNKKGFTLVELIVVISIIAILGTIGFISLQGYGSESRDSKRVSDLSQIRTGIQVYQAKEGNLPMPDNAISIGSGSTVFIYQGYAGTGTLNTTRVSEAKDPVDDKYYTYSVDSRRTKFQLITLLENGENISKTSYIPKTFAEYENRTPFILGFQLGTLLEGETKIPMQEYAEDIDLSNNTQDYIPVFDRESKGETMSGELIVEKMEKVSAGLDVYDSCEGTEHTKTKNFYDTQQVGYGETCEPNTQTFTCNDGEWYNEEGNVADRETYSYESCSVAGATNCPANETYTYNTNTYNVAEVPHSSYQTIISEEINQNNGTFTYTLNLSCDNGEYTDQTETGPDLVSCDEGYSENNNECELNSKTVNSATYNSRNYNFTSFNLEYGTPQTKTSQSLNITNGTSTLTTKFTLSSDGNTVNLSEQSESISCNNGYEEENGNCEEILYASCKAILDDNMSTGNGVYTVYSQNNGTGLDVYCDMTTNGGGWTLVANVNRDASLINSSEGSGNISDINGGFAKVSNSDLNELMLNNKLRFNDEDNSEYWIIEYDIGQELYFDRFKSYKMRLENPLTNRVSPWYINHPHFVLFSGITNDLELPDGCTRPYERVNYSIYLEDKGRYATLCSDSIPQGWTPYIHRTSSVPNDRWHSKNFKLWVK